MWIEKIIFVTGNEVVKLNFYTKLHYTNSVFDSLMVIYSWKLITMKLESFIMSIDYNEKEKNVLNALKYDKENFNECRIDVEEVGAWVSFYILLI